MYTRMFLVVTSILGLATVASAQNAGAGEAALTYPKVKTVDQVDELHGVKVADPYRWLEDLDSPETAAWVAAQNEVTFRFLGEIPARERIKERMTKLWDFERYGLPFKEGGRYFYSKNDGLQAQSVFYVLDSLDGEPRVLIDPNKLSEDGTVALAGLSISEDGKRMAYGLSTAGSDWVEYRVRDIDTGRDLDDHLKWIKFSGASWTKDGQGFYYSRFDEPKGDQLKDTNYYQKLWYHKLGTAQVDDKLVYSRPDQKEWGFAGEVTEDGQYLVITITQGTERKNRVYFQDLATGDGQTIELLNDFDAQYGFINNDGPVFWFFTDLDAPRGRVIAIDTRQPERANWKEIIPQAAETLDGVTLVNDTFIAHYLKDAYTQVRMFDLRGQHVRDVALPGVGTAGGFGGKRRDTETFYSYTSFNMPNTIYRYDMPSGASTVYRQPQVDFDPAQYTTQQVFYNSKDGTRIPMFITHKKNIQLDGHNPTMLYGYGGFNASMTPYFSISRLVWMELGGVFALANIRGGGEYGKAWHDAGRLANKQNCFDDFIAAAEWLIANKYTSAQKLAISGGSNGGLLVGACMTQRPDLFGACLPAVGVMDMLRFHKFTIGWAWTSDYGSPDEPEAFKTLLKYSPLHNLKPGTCYPATLVTTADHDDRVVPAHSFKFISALQAAQGCGNPVLIRIETKAGHGGGKPTQKIIEEISDQYAFLMRVLDVKPAGTAAAMD
ncbi:MAG: S9 family peptidase [Phycisphaerae bacterium]|nr:S9 family peptidase [Phycisphaerae bacterium]